MPREASSSPAAEPAPPPAGAAGATGLPKQPTVQIVSMMDTTAVSVTGDTLSLSLIGRFWVVLLRPVVVNVGVVTYAVGGHNDITGGAEFF